jgi:steroid delta-isomerase-like uncharacterized protein
MPGTNNAALARRWFEEVWNARREATVHELLVPTAVGHLEGSDVQGPEQFLAVRSLLLEAFPDMKVVIHGIVAQNDEVAVRWSVSGTHRGSSLGFTATNRSVSFRGMTWMRFHKGRIVEGWDAWNQGALFAELRAASARYEQSHEL